MNQMTTLIENPPQVIYQSQLGGGCSVDVSKRPSLMVDHKSFRGERTFLFVRVTGTSAPNKAK